ncbi:MAG: CpsB/CapC family capsule biosynthesis tyrosine phosphatase, partial [Rikenellaceae bacterium]
MFALFNKKRTVVESGVMSGFFDFHSHILPGVDDGSRGDDESLEVLEWYEQLGVSRVTFTPHIMERYPLNNAERLRQVFERFRGLYSGPIELRLGAEYMLDSSFERYLEGGDMLTLWDDYLLMETSFASAPVRLYERLQRVMSSGYFVVLAHPE